MGFGIMVNTESLEIMPKTVRAILNINNSEIINLCKVGAIPLKRNKKGLTYFTNEDVQTLQRLNSVQKRAKYLEEKSVQLKNGFKKTLAKKIEKSNNTVKEENKVQLPQQQSTNNDTIKFLKQITGAVKNIESGMYNKFSNILETKLEEKLEEKLGGLDEVIMDLVHSKAENEELRKKLSDKEKEVYSLKNEVNSYKKIAGSLYIKQNKNEI